MSGALGVPEPGLTMPLLIRAGLPESTGHLPTVAAAHALPVMLSAGRLWRDGAFQAPGIGAWRLNAALDSAGFVAMAHHGGYPWTVADYVDLVAGGRAQVRDGGGLPHPWAWWSQMDLCCEPEIAGSRAIVEERVRGTAALLAECREAAAWWHGEGAEEVGWPLPIVQGWRPDDYALSAELADRVLGGDWPNLIGVGSVCRRQLGGQDGLFAVLRRLDRLLPGHVRLHLFGVKSDAIDELAGWPRVGSVDSMAWDLAARKTARAARAPASVEARGRAMVDWHRGQVDRLRRGRQQARLFTPVPQGGGR